MRDPVSWAWKRMPKMQEIWMIVSSEKTLLEKSWRMKPYISGAR